jgi:hypothetical protein
MGFMQRRVPGKLIAVRAVIWCLFSCVWIYLSWQRIAGLRGAGKPVGGASWAILVFWSAVLIFWAIIGLRSLRIAKRRRQSDLGERVV